MAGDSHLGVEWHIVPELCKPVKTERKKEREEKSNQHFHKAAGHIKHKN